LLVGFGSHTFKTINGTSIGFYHLDFYQPDVKTGLSNDPVMTLAPDDDMAAPVVLIAPSTASAINMDQENGDELLLALGSVRRGDSVYKRPEYWLYRGGSSFQVDTPDYVVRDTEPTTDQGLYTAKVMDLDGDRYMDLVTVGQYAEGYKLKMWFGTATSPWTWTTPDREIILTSESGLSASDVVIGRFDGDNKLDFASHSSSSNTAVRGVYLYLTRHGFDARTSSFARVDATKGLLDSTVFITASDAHLNDSLQRFSMLGAFRPLGNASRALVFSGKGNGTDASYEAYFSAVDAGLSSGSILGRLVAIRDCTGDGWQDLIGSSSSWPDNFSGIAVILAGGPYIPLDDPTVSVRTEPMANHERGLYLWPNPATTELNIAWRGDLAAMPARFAVHDITGTMITENEVRPGLGTARWSTAGVASGTYLLTAYGRSGKVIASVQVAVAH